MKSIRLFSALAIVLLTTTAAWAKKKPADFTPFAGNYKGTVVFNYNGTAYAGTATINIKVPKSGKTANATISGLINAGGTLYPMSGIFSFTSRAFTSSDLLLNFPSPTTSVTVPSKLKKSKISALGSSSYLGTTFTAQTTATVKPKGKKKKTLSMTYTISASGFTYIYQFTVTGKQKK